MTTDFIDKSRVIDGKPTSRTENVHRVEDQLKLLADKFAEFANMGKKKTEAIDVEYTEIDDGSSQDSDKTEIATTG